MVLALESQASSDSVDYNNLLSVLFHCINSSLV